MKNKEASNVKQRVQTIIVSCSVILLIGKFIAYYLTNSVGVFTDAMESIVNVTAGFISLYSIHLASKPKDLDHPLGHGKIESISASIEGILILFAGGLIIFEGVQRIFNPTEIQRLDIGIFIVAGAGLINYILGWYSIKEGKKYDSIALVAGGRHLQSDTYSTIGLVIGLILLYFTKIGWIDSALAIIFGGIIAITGIGILRKTIKNLIDTVDKNTLQKICDNISNSREDDWIDVHNMVIIKTGNSYFVDCDITLPWFYTVRQGHDSCELLQDALQEVVSKESLISIHSDPCNESHCRMCEMKNCEYRTSHFEQAHILTIDQLVADEDEIKKINM